MIHISPHPRLDPCQLHPIMAESQQFLTVVLVAFHCEAARVIGHITLLLSSESFMPRKVTYSMICMVEIVCKGTKGHTVVSSLRFLRPWRLKVE